LEIAAWVSSQSPAETVGAAATSGSVGLGSGSGALATSGSVLAGSLVLALAAALSASVAGLSQPASSSAPHIMVIRVRRIVGPRMTAMVSDGAPGLHVFQRTHRISSRA